MTAAASDPHESASNSSVLNSSAPNNSTPDRADEPLTTRRSLFDAVRPTVLAQELSLKTGPHSPGTGILTVLGQRGVLALTGERPDNVIVGSAQLGKVQPGWMLVQGPTAVGVAYGMAVMAAGTQKMRQEATNNRPNETTTTGHHPDHRRGKERRSWCVLSAKDAESGRALDALITVAQRPPVGVIVVVVGHTGGFKSTLTGMGFAVYEAHSDMWSVVSALDRAGRRSHQRPVAVVAPPFSPELSLGVPELGFPATQGSELGNVDHTTAGHTQLADLSEEQ